MKNSRLSIRSEELSEKEQIKQNGDDGHGQKCLAQGSEETYGDPVQADCPTGVHSQREVVPADENQHATQTPAIKGKVGMGVEQQSAMALIDIGEVGKDDICNTGYTCSEKKKHAGGEEMFLLHRSTVFEEKNKYHRHNKEKGRGDDEFSNRKVEEDKEEKDHDAEGYEPEKNIR